LSLAGLAVAMIVALRRILYNAAVQGWASLMVIVLVISGTQMLTMGIFGEYLWRNFEETRKRPSFVVEQVTETAGPDSE
jgi:hypothetical protein